jgi:hypothetical protein
MLDSTVEYRLLLSSMETGVRGHAEHAPADPNVQVLVRRDKKALQEKQAKKAEALAAGK